MARDYYDILGVAKNASAEEIKAAHRKLSRKFHPDVNKSDPTASRKFGEVQEAYDTLGDDQKRRQYDEFQRLGVDPANARRRGGYPNDQEIHPDDFADFGFGQPDNSSQFGDIFDQLFGSSGPFGRGRRGGRHAEPVAEPGHVEYPVSLGFEDAARGTTIPITVSRGPRTQTLEVKIPPGVKTGSRVRIKGRGNGGVDGNDLYIVVNVHDHPFYKRDGNDILLDVPISLYEAILGSHVTVPTLAGPVTLAVPPGTSSGTKIRLKGHGIHRGAEQGDQYCVIKIVVPRDFSNDEKLLIEHLQTKHPLNARADVPWKV